MNARLHGCPQRGGMALMLYLYLSMIPDPQERADFEQVYNDCKLACLHEALKCTGYNQALAEDALHNAVVKILAKYPGYLKDSCSKLKSSFVIIVKHEATDLMRKEKIRRHEALDDECDAEANDVALADLFSGKETYEMIIACVDKLAILLKAVFVQRYLYDMKNKEIAELLGITEKSVSVRLCRAKLQLRELLREEGIFCE
jgi:RNA polymerase sigma-70 factor (ECF subfamily)